MTKTIGFVGTGMIGGALARLAARAGYNVVLSNSRGADSLKELLKELGPNARAASVEEAVDAADLVVAAVPMGAYVKLPAERLAGKIVIDTMNYYPRRDGAMPDIDARKLTTSELIQQHLPGAKLVKALHNLDFHHLFTNARPRRHAERTTLPIAGNDVGAKQAVTEFMETIGYDALDVGTLADSWKIEPGTPVYVLPYVPPVPDGSTEEQARAIYLERSGDPLNKEALQALVDKAQRHFPVGGFSHDLPSTHTALVAEVYQSRKKG